MKKTLPIIALMALISIFTMSAAAQVTLSVSSATPAQQGICDATHQVFFLELVASGTGTLDVIDIRYSGSANDATFANMILVDDSGTVVTSSTAQFIAGGADFSNLGFMISGTETFRIYADIVGGSAGKTAGIIATEYIYSDSSGNSFPSGLVMLSGATMSITGCTTTATTVPKFVADKKVVCQNTAIMFTDSSTGSIAAWNWTFDCSNHQTWQGKNPPPIQYYCSGDMYPRLDVTDSSGNTFSYSMKVTIVQRPYIQRIDPLTVSARCGGDSIRLSPVSPNAAQYYWIKNNDDTTFTNGAWFAKDTGNYCYDVYPVSYEGCVGDPVQKCVMIENTPIISLNYNWSPLPPGNQTEFVCAGSPSPHLDVYTYNFWYGSTTTWQDGSVGQGRYLQKSGDYIPMITSSNGCIYYGDTFTFVVKLLPKPNIMVAPEKYEFCEGDQVTLSTTSYDAYQWRNNNVPVQNIQIFTENLSVAKSGSWVVQVLDPNGCWGESSSINILVNPIPPKAGIGLDSSGQYIAATPGYAFYTWYRDGVLLSGQTTSICTVAIPGFYSVVVTSDRGCASIASDPVYVDFTALGVLYIGEPRVLGHYPNPWDGSRIDLPFSDDTEHSVALYSITGEIVFEKTSRHTVSVEKGNMHSGIYFLSVSDKNGEHREVHKILLQ